MKKLKLGILLLLLVAGGVSKAQKLSDNYEISLGKSYDVVDARSKEYFSVKEGKFAISVKSEKSIATIQKFDLTNMTEVKKVVYEDFAAKSYTIKTIKVSEDKIYFVFTEYDKSSKSFIVKAREINIDNLSLGKATTLTQTSKKVHENFRGIWSQTAMPRTSTGRLTKFNVDLSFDKSKLLVSYRLVPESKSDAKNHDVIGMGVFNTNDLSKVWEREVEMPYTEKEINNYAYGVNNKGEAFTLIRKNETNTYALLTVDANQVKEDVLDIDGELFFASELEMNEFPNGDLAFAGLYGNGVELKVGFGGGYFSLNVDGFYTFTLNQEKKVIAKNKEEFPIEFIKQYLNERQMKALEKREADGKAGIEGLRLEKFLIDEEGNLILLCEQQYINTEPWGTDLTAQVMHYSNAILIKTDSKGQLIWMKKLPKNQALNKSNGYTLGKGGMGIKHMSDAENHYVLYIDNAKNAELSVNEVPAPHKDGLGGFLTAYKINDKTGEVEKDLLFDTKDFQGTEIYQFKVSRIFNSGDGVLLLEVYLKGKKDGMFQMTPK